LHGDETTTTFKCKNCDFVSSDEDARFCPSCGEQLEETKDTGAVTGSHTPCPNCGSTNNAVGSKFCLDCGTPLEAKASQVSKNVACPACGFDKNTSDARFCHQCGAALGKGATIAASVPKQTNVAAPLEKHVVNGPKLKEMPIARLFDKTTKDGISGKILLATDGIRFVSSQKGQFSFHVTEIASAKVGEKTNLLEIHLKNGETKIFRFAGAKSWVPPISSMLSKQA